MADKEAIKREILRVAGNPTVGVVAELAEEWARAIVALDGEATKETRVVRASETR